MTFCEVISNFVIKDFDNLKKEIPFEDTVFFTDDLVVQSKIQKLGYEIYHMKTYFGYATPEIYSINNQAIRKFDFIKVILDNIKYKRISIVTGLKSNILEQLVFLEKIKTICNKRKDVIFLFSNLNFFYFCIPELAKNAGYVTKFGVSEIMQGKISSLNFEQIFTSGYKDLFDKTTEYVSQDHTPNFNIDFNEITPEVGFFLINNDEDFYLKPIYPIINEFERNNSEYITITFSGKTANQLKQRGMKHYDLTDLCNRLEKEMIEKNSIIIANFFKNMKNDLIEDNLISTYFKYLANDRSVLDIARILAIISITNNIFEKFEFKSILVATDGILETYVACSLAKNFTIPSYSVPSAMTELNPIYGILYDASQLLISGPRLKKELMDLGVNEKRLVITGMPRYDYIKQSRDSLEDNSDNTKKKLVVIGMSRMHHNDEVWMAELIQFCNRMDLEVLIKLHPLYKFNLDHHELIEEKINRIREKCRGLNYEISYDADLSELLKHAVVFITEYSLVGVEASLYEVPIISVNIHNETYYDFSLEFSKEGIALYATNIDELLNCMSKILNDKETRLGLQKNRSTFNYEFNYLNDGKASERIFQILTEM